MKDYTIILKTLRFYSLASIAWEGLCFREDWEWNYYQMQLYIECSSHFGCFFFPGRVGVKRCSGWGKFNLFLYKKIIVCRHIQDHDMYCAGWLLNQTDDSHGFAQLIELMKLFSSTAAKYQKNSLKTGMVVHRRCQERTISSFFKVDSIIRYHQLILGVCYWISHCLHFCSTFDITISFRTRPAMLPSPLWIR